MRARITLPTSLIFTVVAACGCDGAPEAADAAADATGDVADVTDAARRCTPYPFKPLSGRLAVQCVPRRGATAPCPRENVCLPEDCPAHCEGCVTTLACVPDNTVDAGVECVVGVACRGDGCNPGCRAVS